MMGLPPAFIFALLLGLLAARDEDGDGGGDDAKQYDLHGVRSPDEHHHQPGHV